MFHLKTLKRRSIYSCLSLTFICLTHQNGFANLSQANRWDYNKAILQSRVTFYTKLIDDFKNPLIDVEGLSELLASIIYDELSLAHQEQIRLSLQQQKRSLGNPLFNDLILDIYGGITNFNYLPLKSILEKMTEGEKSFRYPFMKKKLTKLHKLLSERETEVEYKGGSGTFELSNLLTFNWEIGNQIDKILDFQTRCEKISDTSSDKEKQEIKIILQTIAPGTNFLKELKKSLIDMIKDIDRDCAGVLEKFEDDRDFNEFYYFINEYEEELNKLIQNEVRLTKNYYDLQNLLNGKISKEKPKNLKLKELLSGLKPDKEQSTSNRKYFSNTLLPTVGEKLVFLKDSIRSRFEQLNHRIKKIFESRDPRDELNFKNRLQLFFNYEIFKPSYVDRIDSIRERKRSLGRHSDFQIWLELEQEIIQLSSFVKFVDSKMVTFFLKSKLLASEMNKEAENLNEEIRILRKLIQNRNKVLDPEVVSSTQVREKQRTNQVTSGLESREDQDSTSEGEEGSKFLSIPQESALDEAKESYQKTDEIISPELNDRAHRSGVESRIGGFKDEGDQLDISVREFSQFRPYEAVKSPTDAESDSMISDLEIGAKNYFTPTEDECKAKIQKSITKKHLEIDEGDQLDISVREFSQFRPYEAVKSPSEAESDSMISDLEIGAKTYFTPIEDGYKAKIQKSITKKHLEILEDLFSARSAKFRFETLANLVTRCGGVLQFSGHGGSHFQITLPGGYTSYGWRPHGKAHSSKIQGKILNAFREALSGVADILEIEHSM